MSKKIFKRILCFLFFVTIATYGSVKLHSLSSRRITARECLQDEQTNKSTEYKTILLWKDWFGGKWESGFGPITANGLREAKCPIWECNFSQDENMIEQADAVVFRHAHFSSLVIKKYSRSADQRWIVVNEEPPGGARGNMKYRISSTLVNWTMHYHSSSDVQGGFYGHFVSLVDNTPPFQANFIDQHPEALVRYKNALERNTTLEEVMGDAWTTFTNKTKAVAWMVSNCLALSKRQDYVDELEKYIVIDIYGSCTNKPCLTKTATRRKCWENVLGNQYSFYLSFENTICDEYISEKLYMPMVYGVIPVVYGGADYKKFLPPNSYINARDYHPKELAQLLLKLQNDSVALGRYHLWRGYWKADPHGSFCHLCHRLHTDSSPKHQKDINQWYNLHGNCNNPKTKLFNNIKHPDACKKFINTTLSCL